MTPSPYRPISRVTTTNPIGFNNATDARKATTNQRQLVQGQGDALMGTDEDLGNQYRDQTQGVEDYLHPIYDPMAQGQGGYNQTESDAINFGPEAQQNLVNSAGITAGTRTAADVSAAERAAAAAGGNPMALAAYRERATRQAAGAGADAMTQARVQAKQLESQGAQTTGAARLGQQGQALNYYGQLQGQKNANAQNEQALQQGAFGTTTSGTNAATADVLKASQTPSKLDKIIGGVTGVIGGLASHLADGEYLGSGTDAVVGEDGPEAIIERATDQPFMADGYEAPPVPEGAMSQYLDRFKKGQMQEQSVDPKAAWNPVTEYNQAGQTLGNAVGSLIPGKEPAAAAMGGGGGFGAFDMEADGRPGGLMTAPRPAHPYGAPRIGRADIQAPHTPKIITSPTRVHLDPGDSVVPLTYRPHAKVRPSAFVNAYRGARG